MEEKQYDLFMEMVNNPEIGLADLKALGLTADNTQLLDEDTYLKSSKIQDKYKTPEGEFDEEAAKKAYGIVKSVYNLLSTDQYDQNLADVTFYDPNNIFKNESQNKYDNTPKLITIENPLKQSRGLVAVGMLGPQYKTEDEIAQGQKVLANPVEATNPDGSIDESKAIWHDAPEESFFTDFRDTRVLAQYDEDGTHIDQNTGEEVKHFKGQLKYNREGYPCYENLDGRDVYGRRVLNKLNTLTKEDSALNDYDFFDADNLEQKSVAGVIARNMALVGSMFLPYGIGLGIAAISASTQIAGMLSTLGKMISGSDSPTLSAIEGWAQSWNRQYGKTQYAQEHTWCTENFIDVFADLIAQLREQRAIFQLVPGAIKGFQFIKNEKDVAKLEQQFFDKAKDLNNKSLKNLVDKAKKEADEAFDTTIAHKSEKMAAAQQAFVNSLEEDFIPYSKLIAARQTENFINSYNKIGAALSKTYMAGLISQQLYGEAKLNGLSDEEAALVTFGRFAAEFALLNTPIGDFLYPELKIDAIKNKKIINALYEDIKATRDKFNTVESVAEKTSWAQNLIKKAFNSGSLAQAEALTMGGKSIKTAFVMGLEAGTVNDIEEGLNDLAKATWNTWDWLHSDRSDSFTKHVFGENAKWKNFENVFDRYGMGMASGLVGGGITSYVQNFHQYRDFNKSFSNIDSKVARQQLVYMYRNGQIKDFLKQVDRTTFGDKNLNGIPTFIDNDMVFGQANKDQLNQDQIIKNIIKQQVKLIGDAIEGHNYTDKSFLDIQTQKDLRLQVLQQTQTAGRYLQEYNSILSDLYTLKNQIQANEPVTDQGKNKAENKPVMTPEQQQAYDALQTKLKNLVEGKLSGQFIAEAAFEMTAAVNALVAPEIKTLPGFIMAMTGKKPTELTEEDYQKYVNKWKKFKNVDYADNLINLADAFHTLSQQVSDVLMQHNQDYDQVSKTYMDITNKLNTLYNNALARTDVEVADFTKDFLVNGLPEQLMENITPFVEDAINPLREQLETATTDEQRSAIMQQIFNIYRTTLIDQVDSAMQPILEASWLSSPVKQSALQILDTLEQGYISLYSPATKLNDMSAVNELLNKIDEFEQTADPATFNDIIAQIGAFKQITPSIDALIKAKETNAPTQINKAILDLAISGELGDMVSKFNDQWNNYHSKVNNLKQQINSKKSSPIEEFVRQFILDATGNTTMSSLLDNLDVLWNSNLSNIEDLTLPPQLLAEFQKGEAINILDEATRVVSLVKAAIIAARTDKMSVFEPFGGYNRFINYYNKSTEGWKPLAEISGELANAMEVDVNTILNKLHFFNHLFKANESQKLQQFPKVTANYQYILYNRLTQLLDDETVDKLGMQNVRDAIKLATLHSQYAPLQTKGRLNISKEDRDKLADEYLAITDAIYEWANRDDIKQNLQDYSWIADNLIKGKFNLFNSEVSTLNMDTKSIDDSSFLNWLFGHMALDERAFNADMLEIYKNEEKRIPITTQESVVFHNIASTKHQLFKTLQEAIGKAVRDEWKSLSVDKRKVLFPNQHEAFYEDNFTPYVGLLVPYIQWYNINFAEGGAGVGKTDAIAYFTRKGLEKLDPDLTKNVYYAHATKESAKKFAESQAKDAKYGSHNELMELLFTNMSFTDDSNGTISPTDDQYQVDSTGKLRAKPNYKSLAPDEIPSAIFIDEVGHLNTLQLDALSQAAEKYNIHIYTFGDTNQTGIRGEFQIKSLGSALNPIKIPNNTPFVSSIDSNLFNHVMRLGVSMRTANSLKNDNAIQFNSIFGKQKTDLKLYYYEDANTIRGDKYYKAGTTTNGELDISGNLLNLALNDLRKMIGILKSTNSTEKIGFIYSSADSELYKAINNDAELNKYIEKFPGSTAQGREAKFFIVELNNTSDQFEKELYTAITRSSEASIIITPSTSKGNINSIQSVKVDAFRTDTYSQAALLNFKAYRLAQIERQSKQTTPLNNQAQNNPADGTPIPLQHLNDPIVNDATMVINGGSINISLEDYNDYKLYKFSDNLELKDDWIDKYVPTLKGNKVILTTIKQLPDGSLYLVYSDTDYTLTNNNLRTLLSDAYTVPELDKIVTLTSGKDYLLDNTIEYTDTGTTITFNDPPLLSGEWISKYVPDLEGNKVLLTKLSYDKVTGNLSIKYNDDWYQLNSKNIKEVTLEAITEDMLLPPKPAINEDQIKAEDDINRDTEDDTSPIIEPTVEILDDKTQKLEVANSSLDVQQEIQPIQNARITELGYTFNAMTLGAQVDTNGNWYFPQDNGENKIVTDINTINNVSARALPRIDGVNGLRFIASLFKDTLPSDRLTWLTANNGKQAQQAAERDIAFIWRQTMFGRDRDNIINSIAKYFNLDSSECYITFAIKRVANVQENEEFAIPQDNFNKGTAAYKKLGKFDVGSNETTIHNPTAEIQKAQGKAADDKAPRLMLVAIFGTKVGEFSNGNPQYSDLIEVNLATLTSPLTLLQVKQNGQYAYESIANLFAKTATNGAYKTMAQLEVALRQKQVQLTGEQIYKGLDAIRKNRNAFEREGFKPVVDNVEMFLETTNNIWFIKDKDWLPSNQMNFRGPAFTSRKGEHQLDGGMQYERAELDVDETSWQTLENLGSDPRYVKEGNDFQIYAHTTGLLYGNVALSGRTYDTASPFYFTDKGHPYILLNHLTEDLMLQYISGEVPEHITPEEYFILQRAKPIDLPFNLADNAPKMNLAWVLPPGETIGNYIINLHRLITKDANPKFTNLGTTFTDYRIWQALLNSDVFNDALNNPKIRPEISNKLIPLIRSEIAKLNNLETEYNNATSISERADIWQRFMQALTNVDESMKDEWIEARGMYKSAPARSLSQNLRGALNQLVYPNIVNRQENAQFLADYAKYWLEVINKATEGKKVRYRITKSSQQSSKAESVLKLNNGRVVMDTLEGEQPIMIYGKFDPTTFTIDLTDIRAEIAADIIQCRIEHRNLTEDSKHYAYWGTSKLDLDTITVQPTKSPLQVVKDTNLLDAAEFSRLEDAVKNVSNNNLTIAVAQELNSGNYPVYAVTRNDQVMLIKKEDLKITGITNVQYDNITGHITIESTLGKWISKFDENNLECLQFEFVSDTTTIPALSLFDITQDIATQAIALQPVISKLGRKYNYLKAEINNLANQTTTDIAKFLEKFNSYKAASLYADISKIVTDDVDTQNRILEVLKNKSMIEDMLNCVDKITIKLN